MIAEKLQEQLQQLTLQRSQARDVVDGTETAIAQINAVLQALEAYAKERAEAEEEVPPTPEA